MDEFRTQTIVYSTLKLQNDIKNRYIHINHKTFGVSEISVKTNKIVAGTDATLHLSHIYRNAATCSSFDLVKPCTFIKICEAHKLQTALCISSVMASHIYFMINRQIIQVYIVRILVMVCTKFLWLHIFNGIALLTPKDEHLPQI